MSSERPVETCPRCAKPVALGASYCVACGHHLSRGAVDVTPAWARHRWAFVLAGAVIFVSALVWAWLTYSRPITGHQTSVQPNAGLLQAPAAAPPPAPLMQAQTPAPEAQEDPLPADIIDYLKRLREIELKRQQMQGDTTAALLMFVQAVALKTTLDEDKMRERSESLRMGAQAYAATWANLANAFEQLQPPAACTTLHANYRRMMSSTVAFMTQIHLAMHQAGDDPGSAIQTLMNVRSNASNTIEESIASANLELQQVIDKHKLRQYFPTFVISGDRGTDLRNLLSGF